MKFARCGDYLVDQTDEGIFQVDPDIYTDPEIFELERRIIFERSWTFLTLDSEIGSPHDFVSTYIAGTPILVTRDKDGGIHGLINACRHKGSVVCAHAKGNARAHVCPYHAWSYNSAGKLLAIRDKSTAGFTPGFDALDHDLVPIARIDSYRGFIFGSLSADVPPLEEFLGGMKFFIDLIVDRFPQGIEFVPGTTSYTFRGNWKLQLENGMDAYHLNTAHKTFLDVIGRRREGVGNKGVKDVAFWSKLSEMRQGIMSFDHGHTLLWTSGAFSSNRPDDVAAEAMRPIVGDVKADWMLKGRNYYFFPNMQIQDSQSLMVRIFRPLAVDLTEMTTYCIAPIGESDELRQWRLRQYEDFFNVSGLATPDDSTIYEWCQEGYAAAGLPPMQGYGRGIMNLRNGPDPAAREVGQTPCLTSCGPSTTYDETGPIHPFRVWARRLDEALAAHATFREAAE